MELKINYEKFHPTIEDWARIGINWSAQPTKIEVSNSSRFPLLYTVIEDEYHFSKWEMENIWHYYGRGKNSIELDSSEEHFTITMNSKEAIAQCLASSWMPSDPYDRALYDSIDEKLEWVKNNITGLFEFEYYDSFTTMNFDRDDYLEGDYVVEYCMHGTLSILFPDETDAMAFKIVWPDIEP